MENELRNFTEALVTILTCLTFCFFISSRIPKGKLRFLSVVPIIFIFLRLPLHLSSFALQVNMGFCISWIASFKLILFAFDKDPFSGNSKPSSLLHFIVLACLPINIKENPSKTRTKQELRSSLYFTIIALLWSLLTHSYNYKDSMHPIIIRMVYSTRTYCFIQLYLVMGTALARSVLDLELEQQFDNPHLSTSLQNFWGRRWNMVAHRVLKETIHSPVKSLLTPMLGKKRAIHTAILSTFGVSGLIHELIYFYASQTWPTWEVMWFFAIHGVFLVIEIEVKKGLKGRLMLNPWVSRCLTVAFVACTAVWLCFIQLIQCGADVREIKEYLAFVDYAKTFVRSNFGVGVLY